MPDLKKAFGETSKQLQVSRRIKTEIQNIE